MLFSKEKQGPIAYIVVGLGNPDKQYENTRHNAGFNAIDRIAKSLGTDVKKMKFKSLVGEAKIANQKCLLMKPMTYMNNSGEAVVEAMNFYKVPISHVIVIFDDISLEPSEMRVRRKGTHGGHNGIKSIIHLTGKDEFPRIKLGVGKKPHPDYDLADWVLSNFKKEEQQKMREAYDKCEEIVSLMVQDNIDEAMNRYN
ncbi:MAG: aminoacyl-tRNA hydrolase [Oscillospiraceae bacterium]